METQERNRRSKMGIIAGLGITVLSGAYFLSTQLSQNPTQYLTPAQRVLKLSESKRTERNDYREDLYLGDGFCLDREGSIYSAEESDA